jgi:hypothetical protein
VTKPRKVEEPSGTYSGSVKRPASAAKPTAPSAVRYLDKKTAARLADKIFEERKELLRRLAQ